MDAHFAPVFLAQPGADFFQAFRCFADVAQFLLVWFVLQPEPPAGGAVGQLAVGKVRSNFGFGGYFFLRHICLTFR